MIERLRAVAAATWARNHQRSLANLWPARRLDTSALVAEVRV
jgi:hypothetical protein